VAATSRTAGRWWLLRVLLALSIASAGIAITLFGLKFPRDEPQPSPAPQFKIPLLRHTVVTDLGFSPDGRELVLIEQNDRAPDFEARFFRFPEGDLVRNLGPVAGGACAWSPDGSAFAAGDANQLGVDVWETPSWKPGRKLKVSATPAEAEALRKERCPALAFDCQGNLFTVQPDAGGDPMYVLLQVKAWWPNTTNSVGIGAMVEPMDVSVGCLANGTRLAIAYDRSPPCIELWRLRTPAGGRPEATRQYQIPNSALSKVCLSRDGTTLIAQDASAVRVYRLHDDHAELMREFDAKLGSPALLRYVKPVVSRDGHLAAFFSGGMARTDAVASRVVVVRVIDGAIVFEALRVGALIAFSPDSRFLAVDVRGGINLYAIGNE
jgi:hypothetical protein